MTQPAYPEIATRLQAEGLAIFGAFHPAADEQNLPPRTGTLLLLGPHEPGFWARVKAAPEWKDGRPDPLDRWSSRVIGALAAEIGATPLFPFTGPPFLPFFSWATRSGRAWSSPVRLLVHDTAGLMASYRGALALPRRIALPDPPAATPCADCADQPCRAACPAGALSAEGGYDVTACHGFLDTAPGADCLSRGCAVRRACPVSRSYGRLPEQSAYHMSRFHR